MLIIDCEVSSVKRLCEINPEIDSIGFRKFSEELNDESTLKDFFYYFKILKIKHLKFEANMNTLFINYMWDYLNYNTNLESIYFNEPKNIDHKIYKVFLLHKNLKHLHLIRLKIPVFTRQKKFPFQE
jgi:hypothetical protein